MIRSSHVAPLALAACLLSGIAGPALAQADLPAVTVTTVQMEDIAPVSQFVGRVEAVERVDLQARVSGFLEEVAFKEGSLVQKGDLLYRIERASYEAELAAAEATKAGHEAEAEDARLQLRRAEELVQRNAVAQQQVDQAKAAYQSLRAAILADEARIRQARINLDYTEISAPITGRIGTTRLTEGNLVTPDGETLATIVQVDPIRVRFAVSERDVLEMRQRNGNAEGEDISASFTVELGLPTGEPYGITGRIDVAGNEIDAGTGTLPVLALFDNPQGLLVPGAYVDVIVRNGGPEERPVVPYAAVQQDKEGSYVLLVDDEDVVEVRRVVLGPDTGDAYSIIEGLDGGERVVTRGVQRAGPGDKVAPSTDDAG